MSKSQHITTFDQILDKKYGKKGEPKREQWKQEFEAFRLGVLLEEARIKLGLTQEELAEKVVDYFYNPDIAAEVSQYVGYVSPVIGAQEAAAKLDPELASNKWVFPSDEQFNKTKFFIITDAERDSRLREKWLKVLGN